MAEFEAGAIPEDLVDRIYEAATDPDGWPAVLDALSGETGSAGGAILTRRSDAWMGWRCSSELADGVDAYLQSDGARSSVTTPRLLASGRCGFVADGELFTEAEYAADPFMTEWAAPSGLHHGAATAIHVPNGDVVVVQLMRRTGAPAYGAQDLARLDSARPHLARAGMLAARWRLDRLRSAAEALAAVGLPAVVLDATGRALAANSLVQAGPGPLVWRAADRIGFKDEAAALQLERAFAGAAAGQGPAGRTFPVRTGEQLPVLAHLVPITGAGRDLFGGGLSLLVLTAASAGPPDLSLVRGLFDLTAREAEVAAAIAQGLDTGQIAERQGVSRETARTQVKSVLAKTGTRRRSEAAALLAGIPRLPAGPSDPLD